MPGSEVHPAWRPGQAAFTCKVVSHRVVCRSPVQSHWGPLVQMQIPGSLSGPLSFAARAPGLSALPPAVAAFYWAEESTRSLQPLSQGFVPPGYSQSRVKTEPKALAQPPPVGAFGGRWPRKHSVPCASVSTPAESGPRLPRGVWGLGQCGNILGELQSPSEPGGSLLAENASGGRGGHWVGGSRHRSLQGGGLGRHRRCWAHLPALPTPTQAKQTPPLTNRKQA